LEKKEKWVERFRYKGFKSEKEAREYLEKIEKYFIDVDEYLTTIRDAINKFMDELHNLYIKFFREILPPELLLTKKEILEKRKKKKKKQIAIPVK